MAILRKKIKSESSIPFGAIMYFYLTSAPPGWVICNGNYYSTDGTQSSPIKTDVCNTGTPNLIGRYPLGSTGSIGVPIDSGLPNITGAVERNQGYRIQSFEGAAVVSGAFKSSPLMNYQHTADYEGFVQGIKSLIFKASDSNSVYGKYDNDTNTELKNKVVPDSTRLLPCMKL